MDINKMKEFMENQVVRLIKDDGFSIEEVTSEIEDLQDVDFYIIYSFEMWRFYCQLSWENENKMRMVFSLDRMSYEYEIEKELIENESLMYQEVFKSNLLQFHKKVKEIISEEKQLPRITKKDCDLFLVDGNYDGFSSGLIEYQDSLYYMECNLDVHNYYPMMSKYKSEKRLWRSFYIYELTKEELEKIVMNSLDWLRNINLTSLYKNWKCVEGDLKNKTKEEHFDSKYRNYKNEVNSRDKPFAVLEIFY